MTTIKKKIKLLPEKPGVYQFLDSTKKIIYVGKAKNIKKRVLSYFTKTHISGKTKLLVKNIYNIEYIVVDSELEALLLENNLIKKYRPRYNVMLKDDKTYPWICIKNERFPRIFPTRTLVQDGSEYFGPYASSKMMKTILELIRELYKIRTCNYNLSEKNIRSGKFKACLEFHIGKCNAPCISKETEEEYNNSIKEIRNIIKGNISTIIKELKILKKNLAKKLEFEKAQIIKEKIEILQNYQSKFTVVSSRITNVDVFSIISDKKYAYVNFLKVSNGAIVQGTTIDIKKRLDESDEELLLIGIAELRQKFNSNSKEIIVPFKPSLKDDKIKFVVPRRGDKKHLLELSIRNAKYYKLEKEKRLSEKNPEKKTKDILKQMQNDLGLNELPKYIECFDNSNIQGNNPVSSCVVFKNAKPDKKSYRIFNIKTVKGIDDYATIQEVITRRYKRLLNEKKELPQLIVIDGGKGQLNAAVKVLKQLKIYDKVSVISIAKRLEEIYRPNDKYPLALDKNSITLRILQQIRNEAHRFGIKHHRKRRTKNTFKSELLSIKGIGIKSYKLLIHNFKSINKIKKAKISELAEIIGMAKAKIIFEHFSDKKNM